MATVEETFLRVQRMLTGPMELKVDLKGDMMSVAFQDQSTQIFVQVFDWGTDKDGQPRSLVHLTAPILRGVPPRPELFEWIAKEGGGLWFGHVQVFDDADQPGALSLMLKHTLLGDYLDEPELSAAMYGVLFTADEWDDQLQSRFGGKRFADA